MKKNVNVLIALALLCFMALSCNRERLTDSSGKISLKGAVSGFHVSGGQLLDANGKPFVMRGVNYIYVWGNGAANLQTAIPAIALSGANTVRITIGSGQFNDVTGDLFFKTKPEEITSIISLCRTNHLAVVLQVANETGSSNINYFNGIVAYWVSLANVLIGNEDKVIINIANEWGLNSGNAANDGKAWATAYESAITTLRAAGLNHTLMIDAPGYGQEAGAITNPTDSINSIESCYGLQVFNIDPNKNTMFSVHMYEKFPIANPKVVPFTFNNFIATGLTFCIGEFGNQHGGTAVDVPNILGYCQADHIGWLAWAWMDDGVGLNLVTDYKGTSLTDWGKMLFYSPYGLKYVAVIPASNKKVGPLTIDLANANFAAYGKTAATFNDGVKFFNQDRTDYSSVCAGTGDPTAGSSMELGVGAYVNNITCSLKGGLILRTSYVFGDIYATGPLNGFLTNVFDGRQLINLYPQISNIGQMNVSIDMNAFTPDMTKSITIEPNTSGYSVDHPLQPGNYGDLYIKSGNTVYMASGTYHFNSINTEPDVTFYFPRDETKTYIYIKGGMTLKSRTHMYSAYCGGNAVGCYPVGANPANILVVCGGNGGAGVDIEPGVNWRGTLVATNSNVVINTSNDNTNGSLSGTPDPLNYENLSSGGEFYGAAWGGTIMIHQRTALYFAPFDWKNAQ